MGGFMASDSFSCCVVGWLEPVLRACVAGCAVFLAIAALSAGLLIKAKREDVAELDTLALVPA